LEQFTLVAGTYAIDWFIRGIPSTAVPMGFSIIDVNASTYLPGTAYFSEGSAVVEQEINSSVSIVVTGAPITISIHNVTGDSISISETAIAFTAPPGAGAATNRSIRFLRIA